MNMKQFLVKFLPVTAILCTGVAATQAPYSPPAVPTTKILAMGHLTKGTDRSMIAPVMKEEVPATMKLYLDGTLDQFFFRNDGGGVVFLLNVKTVEEARAILEKLPLGQHKMMEFDLVPLGPAVSVVLAAAEACDGSKIGL